MELLYDADCHSCSAYLTQNLSQFAPYQTKTVSTLFLRSRSLIRLGLGSLLPHTHQPRLAPRVPQLAISIHSPFSHLAPLDLPDGLLPPLVDNWQHGVNLANGLAVLLVRADFVLGGVEFLVLADAAREQDEAGLVGL